MKFKREGKTYVVAYYCHVIHLAPKTLIKKCYPCKATKQKRAKINYFILSVCWALLVQLKVKCVHAAVEKQRIFISSNVFSIALGLSREILNWESDHAGNSSPIEHTISCEISGLNPNILYAFSCIAAIHLWCLMCEEVERMLVVLVIGKGFHCFQVQVYGDHAQVLESKERLCVW